MALLCETVTATTMADLLAARDRVTAADMVELRLDGVARPDAAGALAGRRLPAVVTCRPRWEGGRFDGSEEERRSILGHALDQGADFVDIEWRAGFADLIARDSHRVVVSSHEFEGVPSDLIERARAMRATGAGVIKIAVSPATLVDTLPLLDVAREGNAVVVGMGDVGFPSRALAGRYGSRWTYAGQGIAPGQVPSERMVGEYGFKRATPTSRLFGIVSTNAMHSFSPAMHNAAFAALGIEAAYVPLPTANFADFLAFADAIGIEGVSVTIPFKLDALHVATKADDIVKAVGAANTLRRTDGGWEATNTDVAGFLAPLEAFGGELRGARVSVLGAGGAARAVIVALHDRGATVTLHARRAQQAAAVVADVGGQVGPWPPAAHSWDLLVNCTPLGGAGKRGESPLPGGPFDGRLVYDLTYGGATSPLLADAQRAGCPTLDGLPMLVAQAERQFEWWTGQRPPEGIMEAAVRTRICS